MKQRKKEKEECFFLLWMAKLAGYVADNKPKDLQLASGHRH